MKKKQITIFKATSKKTGKQHLVHETIKGFETIDEPFIIDQNKFTFEKITFELNN